MINLLADSRKNSLSAARTNLILFRYIAITLLAFAFLGGALFVSYTVLTSIKSNATSLIESSTKATGTNAQQQAEILNAKLSEASIQLNSQVQYTALLTRLGQALPTGTVLSSLDVTNVQITSASPVSLKVYARSTAEAGQVQASLQSSGLFSSVVAQQPEETGGIEGYPVVVPLTVTFNGGL